MKKTKSNPGLKFFLVSKGRQTEKLPEEVTGMHLLAKFLFNRFVTLKGFEPSPEGKFEFLKSVLDSSINKDFSAEDAIFPLAAAATRDFDVRKTTEDRTLNTRDAVHIEYCIRKEIENILILHGRIASKEVEDTVEC